MRKCWLSLLKRKLRNEAKIKKMKRHLVVVILGLSLAIFGHTQNGFSQTSPPQTAPKRTKASAEGAVDKAYLQKIWDGWATLDPAGQKQYYAQGPHVFFDIAPLKYDSWNEYEPGAIKVLSGYKAARFTVNDDAQIHKSGEGYWMSATVAFDMTETSGKRDLGNFRWTAIFEKQQGKWLIVHEHVSMPQQ
jgi:ketosteroid isomerase-like protein